MAAFQQSETLSRGARMLRTALGPAIGAFLADPTVIEVMLNPDGRLWVDRLSQGLTDTGEEMAAPDGERIIRLVAHHVGVEVHAGSPRVSAELPITGERFEGLLPPVVMAPAFAIRKPAVAVFTLTNYVADAIMAEHQAEFLRVAVSARKNILVAGGTSTGKTTLTNALLAEIAQSTDRVVLIEDTRELQCASPNLVAMRTKDGVATLSDLVRSSLRLRPDRIPIGEVRGAEALDLLLYGAAEIGSSTISMLSTTSAGIGIGLTALFVFHAVQSPDPLIDVALLLRSGFSAPVVTAGLTGAAMYGGLLLLPLFLQRSLGQTPTEAGLMLMAMGLGSAFILPVAGALTDRYGPRRISLAGGGLLILTTIPFVSPVPLAFAAVVILLAARGAALALAQMPAITAAYNAVDEAGTGDAATLINIGQRLGGALGAIAMVAVIEQFGGSIS